MKRASGTLTYRGGVYRARVPVCCCGRFSGPGVPGGGVAPAGVSVAVRGVGVPPAGVGVAVGRGALISVVMVLTALPQVLL